jgi:D-proline reductase (dithiol) PrdB
MRCLPTEGGYVASSAPIAKEAAMTTMERLNPELRAFLSMYKWHKIDPVPWTTRHTPLPLARVGLVVTACMTLPDQPPFEATRPENDASLRVFPSDMNPDELVNTYAGQNFDHAGLEEDANLLIPLDRLHEMVLHEEIGSIGPRVASICGHLPKPQRLIDETAPEIARMFVEDEIDVALLVPA